MKGLLMQKNGKNPSEPQQTQAAPTSEARLSAILNNMVDGVITIDQNGIIESVNPRVETIFGYSSEELVGKNVNVLMPEPYHSEHDSYLQNYLKTGNAKIIDIGRQVMGRRKDGTEFPVDLAVSEMFLGEKRMFSGLIRDISARVQTENKLQQQTAATQTTEARLSAILNNMVDGVITIDQNGIIESVNPRAETIFGYSSEELVGKNVNVLMPEPYHSEHDSYLQNYLKTGNAKIIGSGRQVMGRRKDGTEFPIDLAVSEVKLGNQRMFTGLVRDISERVAVERQLQNTLALQQAILDSANYAIISTTPDGIIQTFNAAAERMLGYTEEEVVGKVTPSIFHVPEEVAQRASFLSEELGESVENGFETFVAKARRGWVDENEWTYISKDGRRFPVLLSVTSLRNELGEITGYLGIGTDITERKKIDKMKSEFISTVSHELRTPLTSIRGSLGLIVGGALGEIPAKAKPLLDIANKNCERLVHLVNDILDIEKLEAEKMVLDIKSLNLSNLIEHAIEKNKGFAEQFKVNLVFHNNAPRVMLEVDQDRFIQVLTNLISNASKFSPLGERVEITSEYLDGWVRVSVADHGEGIPDEFHERIFQKFAQADSSDTRQKGGTGLGLSITKAIVERLGGLIGFNTEQGVGTTFYLKLPAWQE
jgi:PAS domain S-box-containing protein